MTEKGSSATSPRERFSATAVFPAVIECVALLLVLVLAWKARHPWPNIPFGDADTWGYLSPALSWLGGHGFRQSDGRDWLYPAMLTLFLKTSGSFSGVLLWQRLFGYGSAVFMAITWRSWAALLPFGRWGRLVFTLLGVLPIYVQLENQQNIFYESSLRPESVLPCFAYAQLACVMAYCKYRWQTPRVGTSFVFGALAILLAYACLVLKPSWYFACATTSLPVFVGVFGSALPLRARLATPAVGLALALGLVWLPGKLLIEPDAASRTLLPDALFCVHVRFVERLFEERLAAMADTDPQKTKLAALLEVMKREERDAADPAKSSTIYEKLGFDPDHLMHSQVFTDAIYQYAGGDRETFRRFCFASYFSAVLRYPKDYAWKIGDQMGHFFFPDIRDFVRDGLNLGKYYHEGTESMVTSDRVHLQPDIKRLYDGYLAEGAAQSKTAGSLGRTRHLDEIRELYSKSALGLEIAFLVVLIALTVWFPAGRDLRLGGWAAFFLFLAPFGNAFGVCIVHTLDIYRYRATLSGFLLFALTALAAFLAAVVVRAVVAVRAARKLPPVTSDTRTA